MVQNTPWKIEVRGKRPCPEEARSPRLEPGLDGGPVREPLVAGSATGPSRAQPERATWLFSLPHLVDPPSAGETAGVRCTATWVAVVVMGLGDPDLGYRGCLWGHGRSPLLEGKSQSWCRRLSITGWIWCGLPPRTMSALDQNSWIGAGHNASPELPKA